MAISCFDVMVQEIPTSGLAPLLGMTDLKDYPPQWDGITNGGFYETNSFFCAGSGNAL